MHMRNILLFLLIIIHLPLRAFVEIRSERLSTINGLADNSIRHIYQDKKGFLWMATLNGLSRYDGTSFVNYYPQENEQITLADHRIKSLIEDKNGFLWITTYSDIFNCYDFKKDRFVDFSGQGMHTAHYRNISLIEDDVWLWGKTEGCLRVSYCDETFSSESYSLSNKTIESNHIHSVVEGYQGKVYIATDKGLYGWNRGKLSCIQPDIDCVKVLIYKDKAVFVTSNGIIWVDDANYGFIKAGELPLNGKHALTGALNIKTNCVFYTSGGSYSFDMETYQLKQLYGQWDLTNGYVDVDNRGNYWIHNWSGNLYYIHAETGNLKILSLMSIKQMNLINREQYRFWHDSRGIIWIATYGNGLFAYNPENEQLRHFTDNDQLGYIGSNFLLNIMEDRSGSLWVSSEFSGVSHLSVVNQGATRIYPESNRYMHGLNTIRLIAETKEGMVWIGTRYGGLYKYDAELYEIKEKSYNNVGTYAVCEDKEGREWVGTRGNGLYIDGKQYTTVFSDSNALAHNSVFSILRDSTGRMWIGTFGGGLNLAIAQDKGYVFKRFLDGSYGQRWIRCLIEDQNGWIWVGTSGGVFVFHPEELLRNPDCYRGYDKQNKSLKSNEIRSLFKDSKGRIWIAESGVGFSVCTPNGDYDKLIFKHYSVSDGLVSSMVQAFVEDDQGMIWISTEYGISCFNPEIETFENYFFSDMMLGNVYTESCAHRLKNGRLVFGSNQGLVVIDPKQVDKKQSKVSVTFTDLKLNGISVSPNDEGSSLQSTLAYAESIRLNHHQNSFAIEFSTLDYSEINPPRFSYKLENYEKEWSAPSILNFAAYKNLDAGTYLLRVKACNGIGEWGDEESVLKLVIVPPFWKTTEAFLIYLFLLFILFYLVFRIIHKMNTLRNKVKIEEQLTEYKLIFFTNISHEFRTPLTLIKGALEKIQSASRIPKDINSSVTIIDKSTHRLLRLVNQLIEFRKMQQNKLSLALEETDIVPFIYNIFLNFKDIAESKNITFEFLSPNISYQMYIDQDKVDKSMYNLLSNALKYTPRQGKVVLSLEIDETNSLFVIKVIDNGVGIPKDKQGELFKRFMQSGFSRDSMGVGLHLTHELVKIHKGRLHFEENPNGGSIFSITLPIDSSIYRPDDFLLTSNSLLEKGEKGSFIAENPGNGTDDLDIEQDLNRSQSTPLNKQRILLIEDDDDVRDFLIESLNMYFEVITASDGASGLEQAQNVAPDLIISDVMMPGYSGFEITRRLKNDFNTSHIPIILLTALSAPENHLEGVQSGADVYITKPFSMKLLLTSVMKLIEQREKLREKFVKDPNSIHSTITVTEKDKDFADRLMLVMESQLSNPSISVDDIASIMEMGRSAFYSKVRGVTGYSPAEYMRIMRMKKAARILSQQRYTVAEVSYQVGINDPFYFSRCFKNQFGVSPSVYQKGQPDDDTPTP